MKKVKNKLTLSHYQHSCSYKH